MFDRFLTEPEVRRVATCLDRLRHCGVTEWALTGGLAVELRLAERGGQVEPRALNDLDFVTASFDSVPNSLGVEFLVRHVHPFDPPDKLIAQFVSSDLALRVDVFRTHPEVMNRVQMGWGAMPVLSLSDLAARAARLTLPLARRQPVLAKHAGDFLRLLQVADLEDAERAWPQHRRAGDPQSFRGAAARLRKVILLSADLLISPTYSQNVAEPCPRCAHVEGLELADPQAILAVLGYC